MSEPNEGLPSEQEVVAGAEAGEEFSEPQFQQIIRASYEGPLPPPEMLAGYADIQADLPDRIVAMAERQLDHRHAQEKAGLRADIFRSNAGIAAAAGITLAVLGLSAYLANLGEIAVAAVLSGFDILALVGTFIYGTERQKSQREAEMRFMVRRPEDDQH